MTASTADALALLATRTAHGGGFRQADVQRGHTLAALAAAGRPLTPEQERSGYRLLDGYRAELAAAGVDYAALPAPPRAPSAATGPGSPSSLVMVGVRGHGKDARIFTTTPYNGYAAIMPGLPGAKWHKAATCARCKPTSKTPCVFPARDGWHYPAEPVAAAELHAALSDPALPGRGTYTAHSRFKVLLEAAASAADAQQLRSADDLPPIPGLVTSAWTHQRQAYWFGVRQDGVLLDMEMGTGKSLVAVGLTRAKAQHRALIICPDRVVGVWPKQFALHAGPDAFHVLDGRRTLRTGRAVLMPIRDRVESFDAALKECDCGKPHVCITNYAALIHEPFKSWSRRQEWDAVIFDEVHKIKSPTGAWSKAAADLGATARFRMGLTGTLLPHSPLDAFAQVRAINPAVFGTSWSKFRTRYAEMGGYGGHEVVGLLPGMDAEMSRRVSSVTYRVGAEVLDLPKEVPDVNLTCQIGPKAQKLYDAIAEQMYAEVYAGQPIVPDVDGGEPRSITADNVLVKLLRLAQITGGAVRDDDGVDLEVDDAKEKLLEDVLSDIDPGKPVVVFARFRHDLDVIERVAARLDRSYAELSGRRDDALANDSTLAEGCQVAGVQIQAGGTGVDFTRSHYAVYYATGTSLGDYMQSRKRLLRPGQTESVRFIHLTAAGTYDEKIAEALEKRQSVAAYIGGLIRSEQEGRMRKPKAPTDEAVNALVQAALLDVP